MIWATDDLYYTPSTHSGDPLRKTCAMPLVAAGGRRPFVYPSLNIESVIYYNMLVILVLAKTLNERLITIK